jgi:CBS domain-containing protein
MDSRKATTEDNPMKAIDLCTRKVTTAQAATPVAALSKLMRSDHVGSVVVTGPGGRTPVGIVTDRDIVVEVVAMGLDPATLTAGEIMTASPAVANAGDDAFWALKIMRDHGVRRLPVVAGDGALAGVLAFDDLMEHMGTTLGDIAQVIGTERKVEASRRA